MSPYNPDIHHRRSIRLKGFDYASEGLYFVTMCVQNRECLFGEIKNNEMVLNDAGRMVEKWYNKTHDKFPDIICHEMVIMPNHFHCIWENVGLHGASPVGAHPCVRPPKQNMEPLTKIVIDDYDGKEGAHMGAPLPTDLGEHTGSPLSMVVRWFKTMSTNEYIRGVNELGWPPFDRKLWQRNYYEHIIRDDMSLQNIAYYIENNPAHWQDDDFFKD
jgi:REP element-mobilizing transposase RayT